MSERRVSKRCIEKGTSRCLATIRVASDSEAVLVPPVLPGPPSGQMPLQNCKLIKYNKLGNKEIVRSEDALIDKNKLSIKDKII